MQRAALPSARVTAVDGVARKVPFRFAARVRGTGRAGPRIENISMEVLAMLWTIFVILLVMWLLGLVSSYTLGGYIHLLLVLAVAVALVRLIQGRRPL